MITSIALRQMRNVKHLLCGERLALTPLISMTLEKDDVALAAEWLAIPSRWSDDSVVAVYESAFARWNGSKYAFAFMAGRVALSACIHAIDLQPGDEVVIPGYTCVVVHNAFRFARVNPIYCDIELATYGPDVVSIEKRITPKTRAILLHHLYGLVCRDYETIVALARAKGLWIIEDCAHSAGAEFRGRKVGNLGDVAFFSSERSKCFNTIQGGVAVTSNDDCAERLRTFRDRAPFPPRDLVRDQLSCVALDYACFKHPQRWWRGDVALLRFGRRSVVSTTPEEERGERPALYGSRMPAAIAALAINQLHKVDTFNQQRRAAARRWDEWCERRGYARPHVLPVSVPVFLRYPILVDARMKRDRAWAAEELGIIVGLWFQSNLHPSTLPVRGCPNADQAVARCVNLPCLMS